MIPLRATRRYTVITRLVYYLSVYFFILTDTPTTNIYTLSLHDALPISPCAGPANSVMERPWLAHYDDGVPRSEEHTSELQSHSDLVCRLLLEKKKSIKSGE